jgi:c-di-GMP-related signal transduction protein
MKLEEILDQIYISDEINAALLNDQGIMAELYALVRDIESFHTEGIAKFAQKHGLESNAIEKIVLQSIEDVTLFEKEMGQGR